ncbi:MAG: VCBS repeat-containing protein, partial [Deltaproteobacteria bacterium]|nr:VCBS repeat-containing protein [Deltaproteobacteria bacterium]
MTRRIWIPLSLAVAATMGGCSCDDENPVQTVTIVSPTNGATLTMANDVDNTTAGLQIEVKATTVGFAAGSNTALSVDGSRSGEVQALAADGSITFTTSLSAGSHVLSVTVEDGSASAEAKAVVVADLTEIPCTVEITTPKNGTVLNGKADTDPTRSGLQTKMVVHTTGCSGGKIRVCAQGTNGTGEACKSAAGVALAETNLSSTNSTEVELTLADGAIVLAAEHETGATVTAAAAVNVTVDTVAPACSFTSPVNEATLDTIDVTVQLQVSGAEVGQAVALTSSSKPEPMAGTVGNTPDVTINAVLPEGAQTLTAKVSDKAGNEGSCAIEVTVEINHCVVAIAAPADGAEFNAQDDAAPSLPGLQTIVALQTAGCTGGKVRVCAQGTGLTGATCAGAAGQLVGEVDLLPNTSPAITITLPDGAFVLAAEHDTGTVATPTTRSVNVTVDISAPTCTFVSPIDGAILISQDVNVQLQVTNVEDGQQVTLTSSEKPQEMIGDVDASGEVAIAANLPLGEQTLTATVADQAGNVGSCAIDVTVDVAGCDVELSDPAGTEFIFNIANSNPTGTPAVGTYTIKGRTTRCAGGTVSLEKNVDGTITNLSGTVDAQGDFEIPVTFADGEFNAKLTVTINMANQAPNAGSSIDYFSDFTAPQLVEAIPALGSLFIVNPGNPHVGTAGYVADGDTATAGGQTDINLTVTGVGTVAQTGYGSALSGSVVVGVASETPIIDQAFANNGQQTAGTTLSLAEGFSGTVDVLLTDAAGNATPASWDVRVATVALPVPTITNPQAGTINVFRDLGGDRLTYAQVQGVVTYGTTIPANTQLVLCSTIQFGGAAECEGSPGYYQVPGTAVAAAGASQLYAGLRLPQGTQDVIAVLWDAAGMRTVSNAIHLWVDTKPAQATLVTSPDDLNGNGDGVVSAAELPACPATVTVTFDEIRDGQVASLMDGATPVATAATLGNAATFSFCPTDKLYSFKVLVADAAGNPNESTAVSPAIVNAPANTLSITYQRTAPSISVVAPTFNVCNTNNQKPIVSGMDICDLDFRVAVGSSATRVDFTASAGTCAPASITTFVGGQATVACALPQSTSAITLTARVFDAAGNSRLASHVINMVDTIRPTLAFTSPAQNEVVFAQRFPVTVTTNAEAGQPVVVTTSAPPGGGTGTVQAGTPNFATFDVNIGGSSQTLSAKVTDLAGNESFMATVDIQVNLTGCDVNFVSPDSPNPVFNATTTPGGVVTISGNTTRDGCRGTDIVFSASVDGGPLTPFRTVTTDSGTGNFSFSYTFQDGTVTAIEGKSVIVGSSANGFSAITDLTPPTLQVVTPIPNGSNALFVVAKNDNQNVKQAVSGYLADVDDPLTGEEVPGGQVVIGLHVEGAGPSAGTGAGRIQILQGATAKYTNNSTTNAVQDLAPRADFDQGFVGVLTFSATDSAGNHAEVVWNLTVDVVAPPAPVAVTTDPGTGLFTHVLDERNAAIDVAFTTPTDDGPAGPMTWDFGYSWTTRLNGAELNSDVNFDNPALTLKANPAAPPSAGTNGIVHLTGLPALNDFSFQPRLIDSVGNRSKIAAPHAVSVQWHSITIPYPGSSGTIAKFGYAMAGNGDLNGDGFNDLIVGAPYANSNTGEAYLYFGGSSFPAAPRVFVGGAVNAYLGLYLAIGDIDGDHRSDLLLNTKAGEIAVYLGVPNGTPFPAAPNFTFTGSSNLRSIAIVPDVDGDLVNEVALGDYRVSTFTGQVYVLRGSSAWSTLPPGSTVSVATQYNKLLVGADATARF